MARSFRKLSISDFQTRSSRVEARLHSQGITGQPSGAAQARPGIMLLCGFVWVYLVIAVATQRDHIAHSLTQGSLPTHAHDWIFGILAVLLTASAVLLVKHLLRYAIKRGAQRTNSGGILFGALIACALHYTPDSVWQAGYGLLDGNSQQVVNTAGAAVTETLAKLGLSDLTR